MRLTCKLFTICILLTGLLIIVPNPTFAAGEFLIKATSTYTVNDSETTDVTHNFTLTNQTPNIYATQYQLILGTTRIHDFFAEDGQGKIDPAVKTSDNRTWISIVFREKAVGFEKQLNFRIGYLDDDIAQKNGRIWEINIPRPEATNEYTDYLTKLVVPKHFGNPVQIIPEPKSSVETSNQIIFQFDKTDLQKRGVTALFGDKQVFAFNLRYTLENSSPITQYLQIALPPDTQYQKLLYEQITPSPKEIHTDQDGNWLATFKVKSRDSYQVHATGHAILYLEPLVPISNSENSQNLDNYLVPQEPWQTQNPQIQELAQQLKTPQNIYNFVVSKLSYNYDRVEQATIRLGAVEALNNPDQAICMEFTDLFIALARAAGIPAREINGFAFTQNSKLRPLSLKQDILHAWPEYYDTQKKGWIQIDPTWGHTTQGIDYFSRFDLNHFVFTIHGVDSQLPHPAGFYKTKNTEGKDIQVTPADKEPEIVKDLAVNLEFSKSPISGLVNKGKITIQNLGNTALYDLKLSIGNLNQSQFAILTPTKHNLKTLFPYGSYDLPIWVKSQNNFSEIQGTLTLGVSEKLYETKIIFKPIQTQAFPFILSLVLGTAFATAAIRTRSLLVHFKKR